jgi:3-hydroxy-9,10-secoandrosta-1,3,5(10)-triene-9,17-dione monooxygenase
VEGAVTARPSPAELVRRAQAMVPILRQRADACDAACQVPAETVAMFEAAGFYKILQPARYGGYQHNPQVLLDVVRALAHGCPSSAWCLSVVLIHTWEIGVMGHAMGDEIWGKDPATRASSSYNPSGTATPVDGGFRLEGRWKFSSGCDHCTWAVLGALAPSTASPTGMAQVAMFVAPGDYRIVPDTWHVLGLRGTGSKDVVVDGAFVPRHRTHPMRDIFQIERMQQGQIDAEAYHYPFRATLSYCLSAISLGIAEAAMAEFIAQSKGRIVAGTAVKAWKNPYVQRRMADASALIDAAALRLDRDFAEMAPYAQRGEPIPAERRMSYVWNSAYNALSMTEAVDLIYRTSGARVVADSNPLQRYFRDVNVIPNHVLLNADQRAADFAWIKFGGDPTAVNL